MGGEASILHRRGDGRTHWWGSASLALAESHISWWPTEGPGPGSAAAEGHRRSTMVCLPGTQLRPWVGWLILSTLSPAALCRPEHPQELPLCGEGGAAASVLDRECSIATWRRRLHSQFPHLHSGVTVTATRALWGLNEVELQICQELFVFWYCPSCVHLPLLR